MIERPLPAFRFFVTLDPADAHLPPLQAALLPIMAAGGFQQVSGLGGELEVMAYAEGGENHTTRQLPVRHSWSRIVLSRGVVRDPGLWHWYSAGLTHSIGARRDGVILMFTAAGIPAMAWTFRRGLAAKWDGPTLHAQESEVAIERLEIAHEGLERRILTPPIPDLVDDLIGVEGL